MNRIRLYKLIGLVVAVALGGGISYYYLTDHVPAPIVVEGPITITEFDEHKDMAEVVQLFTRDWKWLSTRDYSEERLINMLITGSPNEYEPRYFGKMKIMVLREEGKFVGFITYYMKNAFDGHILFLAIEPAFRGKRYAQKLLDYAQIALKNMGAKFVTLLTYPANESGIKLYRRAGFQESRDDQFVYFMKPT